LKRQRLAIIDIGSNSIRLVINTINEHGHYQELYNFKTVARLSNHLDAQGNLTKEGTSILLTTLQKFRTLTEDHHCDRAIVVATAAMRKANNRKELLKLAEQETGFSIKLLSEYEEAYFGYLAIVNSTSIQDGITIDIGGGSTEITRFSNRKLLHYHSFPFGAITLYRDFFHSTDPSEEELASLQKFLESAFATLPWLQDAKDLPVIGIGGTARNLSLIHQRQTDYPLAGLHQYSFPAEELHSVTQMLQRLTSSEREGLDGLSKDRVDVIIPGTQAISSLVKTVGSSQFIMSRKGLRDGLFYSEILEQLNLECFPNVVEESFYQLYHQYEINLEHVKQVAKLATKLYEQLAPFYNGKLEHQQNLTLIHRAARVLYLGEHINPEASSQHTFYLLTNMSIDGLNHEERLALACVSSFKSKAQLLHMASPFMPLISKKQLKRFEFLGAILKLAYCLNRTRRHVIGKIGTIEAKRDAIVLPLYYHYDLDPSFEQDYALKHVKHVEKVIKKTIELPFLPLSNFT
jgi:exopolyphosphatase/guanosine-5'-triphosphate,3'-diphosphate pyrophosphatase